MMSWSIALPRAVVTALVVGVIAATAAIADGAPPTLPTAPTPPTPPTAPTPPTDPRLRIADAVAEQLLSPAELAELRAAQAEEAADKARAHADLAADAAAAADDDADGQHRRVVIEQEIESHADSDAGLLVPLGFFAMIIAIFGIAQLSRFKREERLHDTVRMAIERGVDIDIAGILPPPRNDRRRGIVLCAVGAGIFGFLLLADGLDSAGLGLIPGILGMGYLISDAVDRRF